MPKTDRTSKANNDAKANDANKASGNKTPRLSKAVRIRSRLRTPYDWLTWLWYKAFPRHQIRMHVSQDIKLGTPNLTVVFLHGIAATSEGWQRSLQQIVKGHEIDNIRLITLDLLGFGRSLHANWLDYDYLEYDLALERTLKNLKINTPLVLVGHSMGALITADFAANFKHKFDLVRVILVSPPVLMAEEMAKFPDKIYTKSYSSLHRLAEDEPAVDVIARLIQRFSSFRSDYLKTRAFDRSMQNVILNPHNFQTFTKLRVPTLIIHGRFDPLVMRSNLIKASKENSEYIKYVSVLAHHDLTSNKRVKIVAELQKAQKEVVRAAKQQHSAQNTGTLSSAEQSGQDKTKESK